MIWRFFCWLIDICPECEQSKFHWNAAGRWWYDPVCHSCFAKAASLRAGEGR